MDHEILQLKNRHKYTLARYQENLHVKSQRRLQGKKNLNRLQHYAEAKGSVDDR